MASSERFIQALRAGEPRAVDAANRLLRKMSVTHEPSDLTPQQYRCVERVALGMTDKEIGLELGITGDTVREHVGAARKTLGGRSRAHTVVLWLAREAA